MSWQASSWVLAQRVGDPILKIVLLAAANYADPAGRCWPKVETLAFDSEVSKRTIQRRLSELQKLGFILLTAQYNQKGKQIESVIQILMDGVGDSLSPLEGRVTPACHGVGDTTLSPTDSLNNHKNNHNTSARKKKDEEVYSEEFEALWLLYPRTRNTSKKDAWNAYRMLNAENKERVRVAVPVFAADMRAERRPQDKIKHMTSWLNGKMYETAGHAAALATPAIVDWHKTATREQWIKALPNWRSNYNWDPFWGPAPGKPGCMLPEDLLTELEKYQIILQRDGRKVAEAAMSDGSQLRDAINAAHAVV